MLAVKVIYYLTGFIRCIRTAFLCPWEMILLMLGLLFVFRAEAWSPSLPFPYAYQLIPETEIESQGHQHALDKVFSLQQRIMHWPEPAYINKASFNHLLNSLEIHFRQRSGQPVEKHTIQVLLTAERFIDSAHKGMMQCHADRAVRDEWWKVTQWMMLSMAANKLELMGQERFLTPETSEVFDRAQRVGIVPGLSDLIPENMRPESMRSGRSSAVAALNEPDGSEPELMRDDNDSTDDTSDLNSQLHRAVRQRQSLERELATHNRQTGEEITPDSPESSLSSDERQFITEGRLKQLEREIRNIKQEQELLASSSTTINMRDAFQEQVDRLHSEVQREKEMLIKTDEALKRLSEPDVTGMAGNIRNYFKKRRPTFTEEQFNHWAPEEQLEKLEQEKESLTSELRKVKTKLAFLQKQDNKLGQEYTDHKEGAIELEGQVKHFKSEIETLYARERSNNEVIQRAQENLQACEQEMKQVTDKKESLNTENEVMSQQRESLIKEAFEIRKERQMHVDRMEEIKALEEQQGQYINREQKEHNLLMRHAKAADELSNKILEEYKPKLEELGEQLKGMGKREQQLQGRYQDLDQFHSQEDEELQRVNQELQVTQTERVRGEKKYTEVTEDLVKANEMLKTTQEQQQDVQNQKSALDARWTRLREDSKDNEHLISKCAAVVEVHHQRASLLQQRQHLVSAIDDADKQRGDARDRLQSVQRRLDEAEEQSLFLNQRLGFLNDEHDELSRGIGSRPVSPEAPLRHRPPSREEPSELAQAFIDELKQKISDKQAEVDDLTLRLRKTNSDIDLSDVHPDVHQSDEEPTPPPLRRTVSAPERLNSLEQEESPARLVPQTIETPEPPRSWSSTVRWLGGYVSWIPYLSSWMFTGSAAISGLLSYYYEEKAWYAFLKASSDEENALQLLLSLGIEDQLLTKERKQCPLDGEEASATKNILSAKPVLFPLAKPALPQETPSEHKITALVSLGKGYTEEPLNTPNWGDFPEETLLEYLMKNRGRNSLHDHGRDYPVTVYYDVESNWQCPAFSSKPPVCQGICRKPVPVQVLIDLAKPTKLMVHPMMGICLPEVTKQTTLDDIFDLADMNKKRPPSQAPPVCPVERFPAARETDASQSTIWPMILYPVQPASGTTDYSWMPEPAEESICKAVYDDHLFPESATPEEPFVYQVQDKRQPVCPRRESRDKKTTTDSEDILDEKPEPAIDPETSRTEPVLEPETTSPKEKKKPSRPWNPNGYRAVREVQPTCPAVESTPEEGATTEDNKPGGSDSKRPSRHKNVESWNPLQYRRSIPEQPVCLAKSDKKQAEQRIPGEPSNTQRRSKPFRYGQPESKQPTCPVNKHPESNTLKPENTAPGTVVATQPDISEQPSGWSPMGYRKERESQPVCPATGETESTSTDTSTTPLESSEPEQKTREPEPDTGIENKASEGVSETDRSETESSDEVSTERAGGFEVYDDNESTIEITEAIADSVLDEPVIMPFLQDTEVMPEFNSLSSINRLSSVLLMDTFSVLKMVGGQVWQRYQQRQSVPDFFPETLSFSQGNSQFVRHEFSSPLYTFINGSQQSGDYHTGSWGGSSFSWGALGFVQERVMLGIILSEQKVNFSDSANNANIRSQGQSCYSLASFQLGSFDTMVVAGVAWPDYRYRHDEINDRFSAAQWSGYASVSRRIPMAFQALDIALSPSLELLKTRTSSYGHQSPDGNSQTMDIDQSQAEINMIQTGFTLDFQYGPANYQQGWQFYLGWQSSQGDQSMGYSLMGLSDVYQSTMTPSSNLLFNIGASQSLGKNLMLQMTINSSWGEKGNHQGLNINYTQQF